MRVIVFLFFTLKYIVIFNYFEISKLICLFVLNLLKIIKQFNFFIPI